MPPGVSQGIVDHTGFCPADFGGQDLSVSWTTWKAGRRIFIFAGTFSDVLTFYGIRLWLAQETTRGSVRLGA
jgi:hypothetical protein